MKKALLGFVFLFSLSFVFAQEKPEGLFINSKAPEFKGTDQSGVTVNLKDLRKKRTSRNSVLPRQLGSL